MINLNIFFRPALFICAALLITVPTYGAIEPKCSLILLEPVLYKNNVIVVNFGKSNKSSEINPELKPNQDEETQDPSTFSEGSITSIEFLDHLSRYLNSTIAKDATQTEVWKIHAMLAQVHNYIQSVTITGKVKMLKGEYIQLSQKYEEVQQQLQITQFFESAKSKGYSLVPKPTEKIKENLPQDIQQFLAFFPLSLKMTHIELNLIHSLDEIYPDEIRRSLFVRKERTRTLNSLNITLNELLTRLENIRANLKLSDYDLEPAQNVIEEIEQIIDSKYMDYCLNKLEKSRYTESQKTSLQLKETIGRIRSIFSYFKGEKRNGLHIVGQTKAVTISDQDAYKLLQSFISISSKEFQSDFLPIVNEFLDKVLERWSARGTNFELSDNFIRKVLNHLDVFLQIVEDKKPQPGFISKYFPSTKAEIESYNQALMKIEALKKLLQNQR